MNPRKVTLVTRQQDCRKAVNALNSVRQEPVIYFFGPKFKYKLTYSGF